MAEIDIRWIQRPCNFKGKDIDLSLFNVCGNVLEEYILTMSCKDSISRTARGLPEGGELERLDGYILSRALDQRVTWEQ